MENIFVLLAGLAGLVGVAIGAASAHGMSDMAARDLLETASRFLIVHAAALFALAAHLRQERATSASGSGLLTLSGAFFVIGMLLFGGGLTIHGMTGKTTFSIVVPIGGSALMLGWLAVAAYGAGAAIKRRRS